MNIEPILMPILANVPFAGLFWYALKRIEKKDDQLDENARILRTLLESNVRATVTMTKTLEDQAKAIEGNAEANKRLTDRIYDVLTNKHGNTNGI